LDRHYITLVHRVPTAIPKSRLVYILKNMTRSFPFDWKLILILYSSFGLISGLISILRTPFLLFMFFFFFLIFFVTCCHGLKWKYVQWICRLSITIRKRALLLVSMLKNLPKRWHLRSRKCCLNRVPLGPLGSNCCLFF